jgi:hypothetical protein
MLNAFKAKAKRCCIREHEQLVHKLGSCEMVSNNAAERHSCYRREAKASGARAKACIAEGNR